MAVELVYDDMKIGAGIFKLFRRDDGTYISVCSYMKPCSSSTAPSEPQVLAKFESSSKPGTYHYVMKYPGGTISCTCFGFRSPNKCWHYREVMNNLEKERTKDVI